MLFISQVRYTIDKVIMTSLWNNSALRKEYGNKGNTMALQIWYWKGELAHL